MDSTKWNEIQAVVLFAIALLIFTSLVTFSFQDMSAYASNPNVPVRNFAGLFGVYVGAALFFLMGLSSYVIPVLIMLWAAARLSASICLSPSNSSSVSRRDTPAGDDSACVKASIAPAGSADCRANSDTTARGARGSEL